MVAELDGLYSLGWRSPVFFVDDNFIGNKPYLKTRLLPAIINWKRGKKDITFNTEASINLADDEELMGMMVKAGFDSVFIGIETPNEESLAECGKRQNRNRDLLDSVKSIQRAGLQVQAGFIVGFDNDSPGDLSTPDRFYPEQRRRHRDGRNPPGPFRDKTLQPLDAGRADPWQHVRR